MSFFSFLFTIWFFYFLSRLLIKPLFLLFSMYLRNKKHNPHDFSAGRGFKYRKKKDFSFDDVRDAEFKDIE